PPQSAFADATVEREASALVAQAMAASEPATVTLFGRLRLIDFTQYAPRGHYASGESMQRYFRAAMWALRLEFNLVSRSPTSRPEAVPPRPSPIWTRRGPRSRGVARTSRSRSSRSSARRSVR